MTCCTNMLNEPKYYESSEERVAKILELAEEVLAVDPEFILKLVGCLHLKEGVGRERAQERQRGRENVCVCVCVSACVCVCVFTRV